MRDHTHDLCDPCVSQTEVDDFWTSVFVLHVLCYKDTKREFNYLFFNLKWTNLSTQLSQLIMILTITSKLKLLQRVSIDWHLDMHCGTCFQSTHVQPHHKSCWSITLNSFNHNHTVNRSYHNSNSKQDKMSWQSGCLHGISASIRVQSSVECVTIVPQHSVGAINLPCVLHMCVDTLSFWLFIIYLMRLAAATRKHMSDW